MEKCGLGVLFLMFFYSCDKEDPSLTLFCNKSNANPGDTLLLSINATDNIKIKSLIVEGEIYYASGTTLQTTGTGILFENTDIVNHIENSFSYIVPYVVNTYYLGDWEDKIVFKAKCDDGHQIVSKEFTVKISF